MGIHHMRELRNTEDNSPSSQFSMCLRITIKALHVLFGDFVGKYHQVVKVTGT